MPQPVLEYPTDPEARMTDVERVGTIMESERSRGKGRSIYSLACVCGNDSQVAEREGKCPECGRGFIIMPASYKPTPQPKTVEA
jgi:hypothetical protein